MNQVTSILTPAETIIWSADVPDEAALMAVLDTLPELRRIKIDRLFLTGIDLGVLDRLAARGLQVFVDAKIYEIPSKAEATSRAASGERGGRSARSCGNEPPRSRIPQQHPGSAAASVIRRSPRATQRRNTQLAYT